MANLQKDRLSSERLLRWIAEERQPAVRPRVNTRVLVRAFALTFAPLKETHVVPEDKEVEVKLQRFQATKSLMVVQELLQQIIDPFHETAGTTSGIEQTQQFIGHLLSLGVVGDDGLEAVFCLLCP